MSNKSDEIQNHKIKVRVCGVSFTRRQHLLFIIANVLCLLACVLGLAHSIDKMFYPMVFISFLIGFISLYLDEHTEYV